MTLAPRTIDRIVRAVPRGVAALAVGLGVVSLITWFADVRQLTRFLGTPHVVANTAVMSILAGIALWSQAREPIARRSRLLGRCCAAVVCVVSGLTALEYVIGADLGIDHVLPHAPSVWSGRPSPQTTVTFLLLGSALLALDRTIRGRRPSDYLAVGAIAMAAAALLGHLFDAPAMYRHSAQYPHVTMSPATAVATVGLGVGILASRIEHGFASIVLAHDAGGTAARRLLAGLLLLLPPVAIVLLAGAHADWYTFSFASALVLLFALAESSVMILSTAKRLGRSDEARRAIEADVRALVDQAADAIFVADRDRRCIEVNEAACRMLGYSRDELLRMTIADLFPAADLDRRATAETAEWQLQRRDGSRVPVEVSVKILADGRWQGIARDITERKRVDAALARAAETERGLRGELEALIGAVSQTVETLPRQDVDTVLRAIADQAKAMTGARYVAVAIGSQPDRAFERWVAVGMPDGLEATIGRPPRVVGVLSHVVTSGEVVRTADVTQHAAFHGIPAAHPTIGSFLGIPIRNDGRAVGTLYLANKQDAPEFSEDDVRVVTALADRVAAAIEIATSYAAEAQRRTWLQSIIDQLPEGVLVRDAHGQVIAINRAGRAIAAPAGPAAEPWDNLVPFDTCDLEGRPLPFEDLPGVRALRTGEVIRERELRLRQPDGKMLPIIVSAGPVRDDHQRITGAVVVVTDGSERKESERMREEWVAVVAHDLRQPLNTILLSSDRLASLATEDRQHAAIDRIRGAAWRLNRMVEDLLDAARITAHQLTIEPRITDVVELAHTVVDNARLAHPNVELRLVAGERELAWIDGERIEQVLGNLISNAVKYGAPARPIILEVIGREAVVELAVSNEGATIPPEELARLFARFARTQDARTARIPGIGLGLYICRGLIETHGGRIWAESANGTTRFRFTLPRPPELETA